MYSRRQRWGRISRGLDRSCRAASLVRAFLPPTPYCLTIAPHGAYIGSLGPARVGATAGEVDPPPVVGLARFFVRGGPGARRCARSTPGPAVVRPIPGR